MTNATWGMREIVNTLNEISLNICRIYKELRTLNESNREAKVDKQIRKIKKGVEKSEHQIESLEKMDKKRDKACEMGKKMMKKKKK